MTKERAGTTDASSHTDRSAWIRVRQLCITDRQAGAYTIDEAVPLAELIASETPGDCLRGVDSMFIQSPAVTLTANQEKRCRHGNAFSIQAEPGTYRCYGQSGEFLMLARVEDGIMSTIKSFFEVE